MKKTRIAVIALLLLAVLLTGCDGVNFVFTTAGSKTTIEVKNAADGAYGESTNFSVGKGKIVYVDYALDKGELKIDFAEATIFHNENSSDDVIVGGVAESITVGPGDKVEVDLGRGDYVMQVTASGETNGTVTVKVG